MLRFGYGIQFLFYVNNKRPDIQKRNIAMETTLEIQKLIPYLDDRTQKAILELVKSLLPEDAEYLVRLALIEQAEQELVNGNTGSWDNIQWK